MWILETDGEFLQGKRVWLRPGQRYLFGRVKKQGVFQAIDHKGVSRRHFVIQVDKVNDGDGSKIHTRSKVTVIDENSKTGTQLDGEHLQGKSKELKGTEHCVKLGSYPHQLMIKWQPVCLSFFLTAKERKKSDALAAKRVLLEPFDIKTVQTFVMNQTTYVVASKRNTVPGLQALITGKHIVDNSYVDALICATTPDDLEEEENLTPLEKDFDGAWPDPVQYLPPKGKEPTTRPSEAYAPAPARARVFEGWTFVFLEAVQHETLLPAISTGQGKALLFKLEQNKTTPDELVHFMRTAAGEKKFGETQTANTDGGVIIVKPVLKDALGVWADDLVNQVAIKLNQKYIDQADFLDAILAQDASALRSSVPYESFVEGSADPAQVSPNGPETVDRPTQSNANGEPSPDKVVKESSSPVKRAPRAPPVSRLKAFADAFDTDEIPDYQPKSQDSEDEVEGSPAPSQGDEMDTNETPQTNGHANPAKRSRSPEEVDLVAGLLPAAAAFKRRKIGLTKQAPIEEAPQPTKSVRAKKEINVLQAARARLAAEESAAQRDRDALAATIGDTPISEMKNLVVIEEMAIHPREPSNGATDATRPDRWDPAWNGRKNFKRFRRRGEPGPNPRRLGQNTIVPLVEVTGQTYGIGESYWSSSRRDERERERERGESSTPNRAQRSETIQADDDPVDEINHGDDQEVGDSPTTTTPSRSHRRTTRDTASVDLTTLSPSPARTTRLADKTRQTQQSMNATRGSGRGKRGAEPIEKGGEQEPPRGKRLRGTTGKTTTKPATRQTRIPTKRGGESESEEELRFRFS